MKTDCADLHSVTNLVFGSNQTKMPLIYQKTRKLVLYHWHNL